MFKKGLPHTVALSTQINSRNLTILLIILFVGVFFGIPRRSSKWAKLFYPNKHTATVAFCFVFFCSISEQLTSLTYRTLYQLMSHHCAEPMLFLFVCMCVFVCGFCAFLANGWTAIKHKPVWQITSKKEYASEINKSGRRRRGNRTVCINRQRRHTVILVACFKHTTRPLELKPILFKQQLSCSSIANTQC